MLFERFMLEDIRKLIHAEPFIPFTIYTVDGSVLQVPTVDHIAAPATVKRVFVFEDNGNYEVLSPLLIARITVERGEPATSPEA